MVPRNKDYLLHFSYPYMDTPGCRYTAFNRTVDRDIATSVNRKRKVVPDLPFSVALRKIYLLVA